VRDRRPEAILEELPVDLAANAASLGARVFDARTIDEFETALRARETYERHKQAQHTYLRTPDTARTLP
jgi:hypothetical protein